MLSGGVEVPLYKQISLFGAVQHIKSTMNYSTEYMINIATNSDDPNDISSVYRSTATGYILGQLHFATGLKISIGNKTDLIFDYRLLRYHPDDNSALIRTSVDIDQNGAEIDQTAVMKAAVEPYKQHLLEILFNFNF